LNVFFLVSIQEDPVLVRRIASVSGMDRFDGGIADVVLAENNQEEPSGSQAVEEVNPPAEGVDGENLVSINFPAPFRLFPSEHCVVCTDGAALFYGRCGHICICAECTTTITQNANTLFRYPR
jgi:hypothetical protein